jgi:hypothetical protein
MIGSAISTSPIGTWLASLQRNSLRLATGTSVVQHPVHDGKQAVYAHRLANDAYQTLLVDVRRILSYDGDLDFRVGGPQRCDSRR